MSLLAQLDSCWLEVSPMRATLRLRVPSKDNQLSLAGYLQGPVCAYAQTLTTKLPLKIVPLAHELAAEVLLPDPCFWTPELPHLYRAHVELRRGGAVLEQLELHTGLRSFHVRGPNLFEAGKRRVLRGVAEERVPAESAENWHKSGLARVVNDPTAELCGELSRQGVTVIARLSAREGWEYTLAAWVQHPAVTVAVLPAGLAPAATLRGLARNLLLAQEFRLHEKVERAPWAQLTLCHFDLPAEFLARTQHDSAPVLAYRPLWRAPAPLAAARAACDKLQAELPLLGRYAGFIV